MQDNKQLAIVIAGAGGVGLEVVKLLLKKGFNVIATVRDSGEIERVHAEAPEVTDCLVLELDQPAQTRRRLQDYINESRLRVDAVVVCGAICPYGPLETADISKLEETLAVNTVSHVAIFQACMPSLRESRGNLIFISSMNGRVAGPLIGHYSASKFALEALCDVMRREVAHFGVDVTAIQPGGIKTNMAYNQIKTIDNAIANLTNDENELYGHLYRGFKTVLGTIDTVSKPETVAETIAKALMAETPDSRYIVGDDAERMLGMERSASDAELDGFFRETFRPE